MEKPIYFTVNEGTDSPFQVLEVKALENAKNGVPIQVSFSINGDSSLFSAQRAVYKKFPRSSGYQNHHIITGTRITFFIQRVPILDNVITDNDVCLEEQKTQSM